MLFFLLLCQRTIELSIEVACYVCIFGAKPYLQHKQCCSWDDHYLQRWRQHQSNCQYKKSSFHSNLAVIKVTKTYPNSVASSGQLIDPGPAKTFPKTLPGIERLVSKENFQGVVISPSWIVRFVLEI